MVELVRQYAQLCGEAVDVLVCRSGTIAGGHVRLECTALEPLTTYKWIGIGKGHVRE
jgi:gamma-glutamyl phosphate reductase